MTSDETLDILLIEDNPGDVRLIEATLEDSEKLLQRFDFENRFANGMQIHHEETLESGIESASKMDIDVILLDLGLPDSKGLETLTSMIETTEFVPVVVLTGLRDESIGIKAIQHGAQDYLVKGETTGDLLVRSIHHALERNRQERERARRREQLEALNRLNEISQDITHTVITTTTREELERAVCERLVDSDAYQFAWIGEVDRVNDRVTPRVAAGIDDEYFDEMVITVEDGDTARGPTGKAASTQTVQVRQNVQTDPTYEPWRERAMEQGYRSSAAVPIDYRGVLYGILNIYAASPSAFSESEREILSRLGDGIGHAITAIERKEALVSDTKLELDFQVERFPDELIEFTNRSEGRIVADNFVRTDETALVYGRAVDIAEDELREILPKTTLTDDFRLLSSEEKTHEFEIATTAIKSLIDAISAHGGRITSATVDDGSLRFTTEFPPGRDKRQLIGLVEDHCPPAVNRAQRLVERSGDNTPSPHAIIHDTLTEKQRTALQAAYSAGLFDWPRKSTGQELAERLGISSPTFNQHLRAAEQKVFKEILVGDTDDGSISEQ